MSTRVRVARGVMCVMPRSRSLITDVQYSIPFSVLINQVLHVHVSLTEQPFSHSMSLSALCPVLTRFCHLRSSGASYIVHTNSPADVAVSSRKFVQQSRVLLSSRDKVDSQQFSAELPSSLHYSVLCTQAPDFCNVLLFAV